MMVSRRSTFRFDAVSGGVVLLAATACFAQSVPAAKAATDSASANLTLSGAVHAQCGVSANISSEASTIDLSDSQGNLPIATLTESCNSALGYQVTVTSQNGATHGGAALVGESQGGVLNYNVLYDGSPATFSHGVAVVENSNSPTPSVTKALSIAFTANSALASDTYQDVLTVSISGK